MPGQRREYPTFPHGMPSFMRSYGRIYRGVRRPTLRGRVRHRGHVATDLVYGEFEGKKHPKGIIFLVMVLVKHMWIAYCGEAHGRGRYVAAEVWHKLSYQPSEI